MSRAEAFRALHVPGRPLVLFNVWDAGSARAVAAAGASALATGSWSVAAAQGWADGEALPLDAVIGTAARIAEAVDLPVSIDFEGGYARDPGALAANFARLLATGIVGINFEDQVIGGAGVVPVPEQAARIAALRRAGPGAFLNARTDLFLQAPPEAHAGLAGAALDRARAYRDAGADGFFVPGLADPATIARLAREAGLPLNVMHRAGVPDRDALAGLGVARISHGPGPWRDAMAWLEAAARRALGT